MTLEPLNAVHQHGAVYFFENVGTDLNDVVGTDAQDVRIKGRMMKSAQRETVRYDRFALRMHIRQGYARRRAARDGGCRADRRSCRRYARSARARKACLGVSLTLTAADHRSASRTSPVVSSCPSLRRKRQ